MERRSLIWAAGFGLLSLAVYWFTVYPSVSGGDSGGLLSAICGSSVTYPPGYPLFTMLGKLFSLIPLGTVAWRVNMMSATFNSFAAVFIVLAVLKHTKNQWAALAAGGLFAFSPLVWKYAITSEVFALNNFFIAVLVFLAISFWQDQKKKYVYWSALIFGLGVSNHHTIALLGLPLAVWMFSVGHKKETKWQGAKWKTFAASLMVGLLGLIPYAYIPWASINTKELSWGDQSTWQGLVDHFLRRQYGTFSLARENASDEVSFLDNLLLYVEHLPAELFLFGIFLALVGGRHYVKKEGLRGPTTLLLFSFCLYILVFFGLSNLSLHSDLFKGIFARFFQMPNLYLVLLAGFGFAALMEKAKEAQKWAPALAAVFVLGPLAVNFSSHNQRGNYLNQEFGTTLLEALPEDAIYISSGDHTSFILQYLQTCEGVRPDVAVFSESYLSFDWAKKFISQKYPEVVLPAERLSLGPGSGYRYKDLILANGLNALFLRQDPFSPIDRSLQKYYHMLPFGAGSVVVSKAYRDIPKYVELSRKALPEFTAGRAAKERHPQGTWEFLAWAEYWNSRYRLGKAYVQLARKNRGHRKLLLDSAIDVLVSTSETFPDDPDFKFYLYLGEAYSLLPDHDKMVEAWANYLNFAPEDEPNYRAIQDVVKKFQRSTSSKPGGEGTQKASR